VGEAAYGVVLYIVSNAFVKALLFLTAGRMRAVYGTNEVAPLNGVIRNLPFTGMLFTVGIFALLGFPPFASFMAEMLILSGIVQAGNLMAFTVMCGMLTIIFVSTCRVVFPMLWDAPKRIGLPVVESLFTVLPKMGFVAILIMLGTYTPEPSFPVAARGGRVDCGVVMMTAVLPVLTLDTGEIPESSLAELVQRCAARLDDGERLVTLFGRPDGDSESPDVVVTAVLASAAGYASSCARVAGTARAIPR
jgi:formate hydrogenlyase subunit 3/multisubunit Na+/H+ antiporter MnhD subunit